MGILFVTTNSCSKVLDIGCGNDVAKEYPSPGAKKKMVVFIRDCGATTGFSTQVSLIDEDDDLPGGGGNVLVLDGKHGDLPVAWNGEDRVIISVPKVRTFKAEAVVAGVFVSYKDP